MSSDVFADTNGLIAPVMAVSPATRVTELDMGSAAVEVALERGATYTLTITNGGSGGSGVSFGFKESGGSVRGYLVRKEDREFSFGVSRDFDMILELEQGGEAELLRW